MNYEQMSDFEINKAVAKALGKTTENDKNPYGKEYAVVLTKNISGGFNRNEVDYCNNPADAWPVMLEHGIGVYKDDGKWISIDEMVGFCGIDDACGHDYEVVGDNPLRAAMIVFLLMQEDKA